MLGQIGWFVFANFNFKPEHSKTDKIDLRESTSLIQRLVNGILQWFKVSNKKRRRKKIDGIIQSLIKFLQIKSVELIYFINYELEPETDFHHVHMLLGKTDNINKSADEICEFLYDEAGKRGFGKCLFEPYDNRKGDGVGYCCKRVFDWNKKQEILPDFQFSNALLKEMEVINEQ